MSNTKNLANLAAALDDGTSGQVLQSTGSGGVQFADSSGSGVTTHTNQDAMVSADASSAYTEGSLHYDLNTNKLFVKMADSAGAGFYQIAAITNTTPTISSPATGTAFTLDSSGSPTTISVTASDDDVGQTLNYYYTVSTGSIGSGTTVTTSSTSGGTYSSSGNAVAGSSNASTNSHFRITPSTSVATEFSLTFYVTDGTNIANTICSFSLAFKITDSHYTTLLMATDGSAGDNDTITDSSSSNNTITPYGNAHAGTFSPYRHGGYSAYMENTDDLTVASNADLNFGSGDFTIEYWIWPNGTPNNAVGLPDMRPASTNGTYVQININTSNQVGLYVDNAQRISQSSSTALTSNAWNHVCLARSGSTTTLYIGGASAGSWSDSTTYSQGRCLIAGHSFHTDRGWASGCYVADFRIVKGTAITPASGGPAERLTAVTNTSLLTCHLPYIADGSSSDHSITINGNIETRPFGPYDYSEYDESVNGGSIYFDGSGDYLKHVAPALGTGDFEISCWIYPSTLAFLIIFDYRNASNTNNPFMAILSDGKLRLYAAGDILIDTASGTISANQWQYVTYKRVSGTSNLYVNGSSVGSATDTTNFVSINNGYIGRRYDIGSYQWQGYISDFRILISPSSNGYATPTAPLSSSGTTLHIKGTDASIIDKSQGSNILLVGSTNETESPYSSGRSIGLTNAHSTYVEIPKRDEFLLGDTFTIEGWIKPTSLSNGYNTIFTGNGYGYYLAVRSNGGLNFYSTNSGTPNYDTAAGVITNNTWHYIAAVCSSGTLTLYSGTSSSNFAARGHGSGGAENSVSGFDLNNFGSQFNSGDTRFGVTHVSSQGFAGYFTDWRFSKGIARTVTFPSSPLKG